MAAEDKLDLVIHVGDYIYEYGTNLYTSTGGNPRGHSNREITTLADYRERHAQYRTDPDLQAAHAAAPWLVTFDDHEIDNNWAGEVPEEGMPHDAFLQRHRAAFRAYWEHMPLRRTARPSGDHIQIFRRAQYGNLATFHVLDTRQFRADQACGDGVKANCDARLTQSITGAEQEAWLYDGLDTSPATWQIIANQVFMAQQDFTNGAGESYMDAWDGYRGSRDRLLAHIEQKGGLNPIVITGDVHANWAADLLSDFSNPASKVLGSEFIGTSISTTGDGSDASTPARLTENPWIKFNIQQRGYVRVALSPTECRGDFRVVPYVKRPGAPISTRKSYVVEAGHPGLQDAAGRRRGEPGGQRGGGPAAAPLHDARGRVHAAGAGVLRRRHGRHRDRLHQHPHRGGTFSGQAFVRFDNKNADGSRLTLPLDVDWPDAYGVSAGIVTGPNYGKVQVSIDGRPLGPVTDAYSTALGRTIVPLGGLELSKGRHALTLDSKAVAAPTPAAVDNTASTVANVVTTAGDAALNVSDPGHPVNGSYALPQPMQVTGVPKTWTGPASNDPVTIGFKQAIGATDALRSGTYSRQLTFTLSTTNP